MGEYGDNIIFPTRALAIGGVPAMKEPGRGSHPPTLLELPARGDLSLLPPPAFRRAQEPSSRKREDSRAGRDLSPIRLGLWGNSRSLRSLGLWGNSRYLIVGVVVVSSKHQIGVSP